MSGFLPVLRMLIPTVHAGMLAAYLLGMWMERLGPLLTIYFLVFLSVVLFFLFDNMLQLFWPRGF